MNWEKTRRGWKSVSPTFGPVQITRGGKPVKFYLLTDPWTGDPVGLGVFNSLADAKKSAVEGRKNPAKLERCVKKVQSRKVRRGRKKPRSAYAICTASLKRNANPPWWYIHIQRGRGPVMLWNGKTFNNDPRSSPKPFPSSSAAMHKARQLLGLNKTLQHYRIWVADWFSGSKARRVNPESLDAAAEKLENFTGMPATHVERVQPRSRQKTGYVLGELDLIGYRARRKGIAGGKMAAYTHKFRIEGSRPLLATSTDGKQLKIVGGRYEVTEAGIEDR